jgi:alpha-L-fucosidase
MKQASLLSFFLVCCIGLFAQNAPKPYGALPSDRQLKWHQTEIYGLIHFTPTTFENKEWGYGDANPSIFNPSQFDAEKIIVALKAGGLKGVILVTKHHDGFALWPTKTTAYNISQSPFRNGKGDLVKEIEQACRKLGMKFGVYCSPWDRNNPRYGTNAYVQDYRNQLKELYSNYGELFMSWHDGANGGDGYYGGARTTKKIDRSTYYGWDTTWSITRRMQPNANIFSDIGWDVRWVGNERGFAAETSWATFTPVPVEGESKTVPGQLDDKQNPYGTRNGNNWVPAECDVPLRKGWFYHPEEKDKVKSPAQLFDLYLKSVGRGAALDLGIAPDTRGLLADEDVKSLEGFGKLIRESFKNNLAHSASISSADTRGKNFSTPLLKDDNLTTYWSSKDEVHTPTLEFAWKNDVEFDLIRLREFIPLGQRIESFDLEVLENREWKKIASATSVGACRIIYLEKPVKAQRVRVKVNASPVCVTFSEIGFYKKSDL